MSAAISPVVTQVIGTAELLETILLFLDLHTLLLAKRVSTRFRDTMDASINIQKALFFEPLSNPTDADIKFMETYKPYPNPLPYEGYDCEYIPPHLSPSTAANCLLDNYLEYSFQYVHDMALHPTSALRATISISDAVVEKLAHAPDIASWRRMLVVQPHAAPVFVRIGPAQEPGIRKTLNTGLSMGEFVTLCANAHSSKSTERHYRTVQLYGNMAWALGPYSESTVYGECRGAVIQDIRGWDVCAPDYGQELESHSSFWENLSACKNQVEDGEISYLEGDD